MQTPCFTTYLTLDTTRLVILPIAGANGNRVAVSPSGNREDALAEGRGLEPRGPCGLAAFRERFLANSVIPP